MPHNRLLPLLIVGAACLPLAACGGGDDEPAASATQPGVPAETTPAAPADTTAEAAPGETAATPAPADAPDAKSAEPAAPKGKGDDASSSSARSKGEQSGASSSSTSSSKPSTGAAKGKQSPAPDVPKVLKDYAKGGAPATEDQASAVRKTMLEFQDALVAQDAGKACSYTHGLPAKSDPSSPTPSCEALIEGSKMAPPTDKDREMINTAKIVVNGDRASIEMGGSGVPMPFRNVDGRWRIDYGTLLGINKAG